MPFEGGAQGGALGLRFKKTSEGTEEVVDPEVAADIAPCFMVEDEISQEEQFKLDKKKFAEQMKQQLYGNTKPAAPSKTFVVEAEEELKDGRIAGLQRNKGSSGNSDDEDEDDDEKSFESQIEMGEAELADSGRQDDATNY